MSRKDEEQTKMERAKNELKKGEEESAATAVVGQSRGGNTHVSGVLNKPVKMISIALLLIAIAFGGIIGFFSSSILKKESTVSVEQIREIAKLATAEAYITVTMKQEDHKLFGNNLPFNVKLPGTKREVLMVVPATVIAGVNLKEVTSDDIKVNEDEKKLEIVLPRATLIQEPAILMDRVEYITDEGILGGKVELDKGFNLLKEAQKDIKKEVDEIGLLQSAEESAEKFLKGFFENLDYTTVEVTFK